MKAVTLALATLALFSVTTTALKCYNCRIEVCVLLFSKKCDLKFIIITQIFTQMKIINHHGFCRHMEFIDLIADVQKKKSCFAVQ